MIILLCHGLNFLHNTIERPFIVLDLSIPSCMKVSISCKPSEPSQFLSLGLFLLKRIVGMYALVSCIFKTAFTKFMSSMHLSYAPQLNAGFMSIRQLFFVFLTLYDSLQWLARVLSSVSLSTIITTIATCRALDWPLLWHFLILL